MNTRITITTVTIKSSPGVPSLEQRQTSAGLDLVPAMVGDVGNTGVLLSTRVCQETAKGLYFEIETAIKEETLNTLFLEDSEWKLGLSYVPEEGLAFYNSLLWIACQKGVASLRYMLYIYKMRAPDSLPLHLVMHSETGSHPLMHVFNLDRECFNAIISFLKEQGWAMLPDVLSGQKWSTKACFLSSLLLAIENKRIDQPDDVLFKTIMELYNFCDEVRVLELEKSVVKLLKDTTIVLNQCSVDQKVAYLAEFFMQEGCICSITVRIAFISALLEEFSDECTGNLMQCYTGLKQEYNQYPFLA